MVSWTFVRPARMQHGVCKHLLQWYWMIKLPSSQVQTHTYTVMVKLCPLVTHTIVMSLSAENFCIVLHLIRMYVHADYPQNL